MSFIEVIIGILVGSILMMSTLFLLSTVLNTYTKIQRKTCAFEEMTLTLAFIQQEIGNAKTVEINTKRSELQDESQELLKEIILDGGTGRSRKVIAIHDEKTQVFKLVYSAKGTIVGISEGKGYLYAKLKGKLLYLTCMMKINGSDIVGQHLILPITYKK